VSPERAATERACERSEGAAQRLDARPWPWHSCSTKRVAGIHLKSPHDHGKQFRHHGVPVTDWTCCRAANSKRGWLHRSAVCPTFAGVKAPPHANCRGGTDLHGVRRGGRWTSIQKGVSAQPATPNCAAAYKCSGYCTRGEDQQRDAPRTVSSSSGPGLYEES
jgi:hypothetical protein